MNIQNNYILHISISISDLCAILCVYIVKSCVWCDLMDLPPILEPLGGPRTFVWRHVLLEHSGSFGSMWTFMLNPDSITRAKHYQKHYLKLIPHTIYKIFCTHNLWTCIIYHNELLHRSNWRTDENTDAMFAETLLGSKHPVAILELEKKNCRQNPHVEISSRM